MPFNERIEILKHKKIVEPRGWFQKPLIGLSDPSPGRNFGEIYSVKALPCELRGIHYHQQATEWFFVVTGDAKVFLYNLDSGDDCSLRLSEDVNQCLKVQPGVAHVFIDEEKTMPFLLVATDTLFAPDETIPYSVPVS